jgi:hypothetical protein
VIPRVLRRPSVSIALVVAALAGCVTYEPAAPVKMPAPAGASSEQLRWAVEAALAARNWTVTERAPGSITAFVLSRGSGDQATVEVTYKAGAIEIRCVKQEVSPQRYDRWMQLLSSEIQKNVAQLGMGKPPAPPPPPPPSPAESSSS